jgi:hypothetical protein
MSNQRIIAIALAMIMIVCIFTACKKQTPHNEISTTSSTIAETKESVTEESTTVENSTEENTTEKTKELGQTEKSTEVQTTKKAESTNAASRSAPSTTQKSKEPETTKAPSTTKAPPQTTKAPETTTQKPTTTQPTTKAQTIDIDYYVNFAIEYGKSIGLKYLPEANECWDTPIGISATNHDYAIRDIKGYLNRYKNIEGDEYFCVWTEKRSNGDYWLYIGYA